MSLLPALDGAYPDRPDAVRVDGRAVSWSQLRGRADALAAEIAGAPAVAVDATPTLDTIVGVVAGLLAGVPVVPVPADAGPRERAHLLADSGAPIVVGRDVPADLGTAGSARPEPPLDAPALIVYTSGTTGPPKGAVLRRSALAAGLDALRPAWGWTAEDTLVHGLPLFHVHGLILGILGPLRLGCRLVHTGRPTPAAYAGAGGTLFFGVPTVWSRICAQPAAARALRRARLLVSGSAALPRPVFDGLTVLCGQQPVERYGMTETLITLSTRVDGERRPGWVGQPVSTVDARVVDERLAPVPADGETLGELQVRGGPLFDGYLRQPEATRAAHTADGWFRTGDVAAVGPDGWHRIAGRASTDVIKTGGYKVGAGEVENALLAHPAVAEAAVVGAPHADLGEEVVAYVVATGTTAEALIGYVADQLSVHKRPRRIVFVEALPRNAMGKVQKKLLS